MDKIIQITFMGKSGFCCSEDAYSDKLVIRKDTVCYMRKGYDSYGDGFVADEWICRNSTAKFERDFHGLASSLISMVMTPREAELVDDFPTVDVVVTLENGRKWSQGNFPRRRDNAALEKSLSIVRKMIPDSRATPQFARPFKLKKRGFKKLWTR